MRCDEQKHLKHSTTHFLQVVSVHIMESIMESPTTESPPPPPTPTPTGSGIFRSITPTPEGRRFSMRPNITLVASQKNPGLNTNIQTPPPTTDRRMKLTRGKSIKLDYMDDCASLDDELWETS
ncbi:unnamed protein product [Medioppia subpectinata]|uniref:Uncharacterized protein n=1 Tax=Medioppia subpectinata TaxID=1979941 RepID=A0A7R9KV43_9ACAR|nr:unnamed protein product [Medioppia subpectinata]CAG2109282.1 unnamed protein product [Medioppia subpectinata]